MWLYKLTNTKVRNSYHQQRIAELTRTSFDKFALRTISFLWTMKNLYAHISNNSTNNPQNSWTNKITKKKTVTQTFSNLIIQSLELFDWTRSPDNFKTIEKILTTRAPPFVQISPREIEFSTSRRDYLCGNPNRVEILKVGETALGITAAAIRLIALSQPRPFPLYSSMFTYENDAPQVDALRSPPPCSSGLLVFPVRGISISLPPSFSISLSPSPRSPLYPLFLAATTVFHARIRSLPRYYYIRKSFGPWAFAK